MYFYLQMWNKRADATLSFLYGSENTVMCVKKRGSLSEVRFWTRFLWFLLHCEKKLFTSHSKSFSFYQLEKIRIKWTHPFSQSLVVVMIQHLFFIQTTCWISEKEEIHAGHRSGATQSLYRFIFFVASAILHLKPLNVALLPVILRQVFLNRDILGFGISYWPDIQPSEL